MVVATHLPHFVSEFQIFQENAKRQVQAEETRANFVHGEAGRVGLVLKLEVAATLWAQACDRFSEKRKKGKEKRMKKKTREEKEKRKKKTNNSTTVQLVHPFNIFSLSFLSFFFPFFSFFFFLRLFLLFSVFFYFFYFFYFFIIIITSGHRKIFEEKFQGHLSPLVKPRVNKWRICRRNCNRGRISSSASMRTQILLKLCRKG